MSNPDRCQSCGAHRASHNPKAYTGCSKFRRRTEQEEASARETEAAFFAVVRASNEAKAGLSDEARAEIDAFRDHLERHRTANATDCRFCDERVAPPQKMMECPRCDGCGWYEGGPVLQNTCEVCTGTGVVSECAAR